MPYKDFPAGNKGVQERKAFWMSDDGLQLIAGWRREGMAIDQIALEMIGISDSTMRRWMLESDTMRHAMDEGMDVVNSMVEASLLKRALGYDAVEEDWDLVEGEMRLVHRRTRHVPADTKAALSWLFSRRPDRWRAQQPAEDVTAEAVAKVQEVTVSIVRASEADECRCRALEGGGTPSAEV